MASQISRKPGKFHLLVKPAPGLPSGGAKQIDFGHIPGSIDHMKQTFICAAIVSFGLSQFLCAEEKSAHTLSEWKLGSTLFGEDVSEKDMEGKVVVIEHWGVNCPPCIALLPHLAKMDKRYRDDGLLIIGAESQNHSKDQIAPLVKKNSIEYTITSGANGPIDFSGIPRAFVFDVQGQLIFNGNPQEADFEKSIKKALKDVGETEEASVASSQNLFETKSWTNAEGKEIKAAVSEASETEVTFLMFAGKVVKYPLEKLSEESRKEITEARLAKSAE
jgi:thiol-disulfide isomerase/thioredoxin